MPSKQHARNKRVADEQHQDRQQKYSTGEAQGRTSCLATVDEGKLMTIGRLNSWQLPLHPTQSRQWQTLNMSMYLVNKS